MTVHHHSEQILSFFLKPNEREKLSFVLLLRHSNSICKMVAILLVLTYVAYCHKHTYV